MIPILFAENSTDFTTNGIGRLSDAISCVVDEERNGQFELQMVYPESGVHFSDIGIRKIIVAKPSASGSLQSFRIYKISRPINGKVTIYGQHISYDLSKNVCMPFSVVASSTACNTALQGLKTNAVETCPFTFWTDVDTVASYSQSAPASIRQRLGGVEGSILDQFNGEYEWDNFTVKFHEARGTEKDITLRYGKNITDLEQEENIANTVTGVVPFWINTDKSESVTLTEKVVYAPNASRYSSHLTVPLDLSGEFENKPTEAQLRNKATIYVNQSGFGLPKVSIKVSFVNLADTAEYADILPLQTVSLCDTIKVQFERLGIDTTAKVVKTTYDVLNERYNSIEVGSLKSTLATTINDMNQSMAQNIEEADKRMFADTSDYVDNATAWLTSSGGYVVAVKNTDGSWKELLFLDHNDILEAVNVLRINENGIGFSSSGVSGPYKQGWTLDGNILIGGSNAAGLTVYKRVNGVDTVLFQVTPQQIIWNTPNSSMSSDGTLTATNVTISGKYESRYQEYGHTKGIILQNGSIYGVYDNNTRRMVYIDENISMQAGDIYFEADDYIEVHGDNRAYLGTDNGSISIGSGGSLDIHTDDDIYIHSNGNLSLSANGDVEVNGAITRTFEYKNEDGNNSWLEFKGGILVDWG